LRSRPTVLKLGGSVITRKEKAFTANSAAINRLAEEIAEAKIPHLIVVHGGGSFGHPLAKEYAIKEGFRGGAHQLLGFSKTHESMIALNNMVLKALIQHNIAALSIAPSSLIVTKAGRIASSIGEPLRRLLDMRLVPLLYGDAVLDSDLGFTILSGDQLVASIATELNAEQLVIGIDEDGLFTADPKSKEPVDLIRVCTLKQLRHMQKRGQGMPVNDVTGGMHGKLTELIPVIEKGIMTQIVNASKPERVYKALRGEKVIGTCIKEN
jgi:isopentenyl phosphate kinase